jgi:iron complex outermembrane recepter protein
MATTTLFGMMIGVAASSTMAQVSPAAEPSSEIVVTGSRLLRKDYVSISPISTVSAAQIESSGSLAIEQVLNTLPQVVAGFSATSNNPSDGTSTVDLRGLGAARTLVLVNGHRMTPATKLSSATDLNTIPSRLIKRVEVITGGASSTYGSDALAGVVNFILKDDFEGVELSSQYGLSQEGDGEQFDLSLILGSNFAGGRGNLTAFVSYYDRNQVLAGTRDWAFFSNAGGSATGISGRADNQPATNAFPATATVSGCGAAATSTNIAFTKTGAAIGACNDFDLASPATNRYNFSPVNNLQSPAERISLALFGKYDLSDSLKGKLEVFYTDNRVSSQLAPTPMTGLSVPIDNPYIKASFASILAARPTPGANFVFRKRMLDVGVRVQESNNKQFQFVTGLEGTVFSDWKWDSTFNYGRTEFRDSIKNDVSRSRLTAATRGTAQGATATSCGTNLLALFPGCKPFNLFGEGSASKDAINFVRLDFSDSTVFERFVVGGNIAGDLFELPAGPLGLAAGFEYREDTFTFKPDAAKGAGDIFGFNAEKAVSGGFNVKEAYAELSVPIVKDLPFISALNLELGGRISDYSTVGQTEAYKLGIDWKVDSDIRARGMYQKASRAPSAFELFQSGDQGFPQFTDPCSTANVNTGAARTLSASTQAFCALQLGANPVTLNFVQPNSQIESFSYGNKNLSAEKSDTYTFGLVWRPSYVKSLNVTLDYYNIKVEDYINTEFGGAAGVVTACFASRNLASDSCFNKTVNTPAVYRDSTGELKVVTNLGNVSALQTKGVDFTVDYKLPLPFVTGTTFADNLGMNLIVTRLDSYKLDGIEYAGTAGNYNINVTLPDWKANLLLSYKIGDVTINTVSTFISEMENQGNIADFEDGGYNTVPQYWTHSLQGRWDLNPMIEVYGGVKNLTDLKPPVFDNSPDGNTDPNTYDVIGRYYYIGTKIKM